MSDARPRAVQARAGWRPPEPSARPPCAPTLEQVSRRRPRGTVPPGSRGSSSQGPRTSGDHCPTAQMNPLRAETSSTAPHERDAPDAAPSPRWPGAALTKATRRGPLDRRGAAQPASGTPPRTRPPSAPRPHPQLRRAPIAYGYELQLGHRVKEAVPSGSPRGS